MLFSLVKVALALIFVTKTASTDLAQERSIFTQPVYYDCGSWIVYEILIQKMLYTDETYIDERASLFIELLYNLELGYRKINLPWDLGSPVSMPRKNKRPRSNFSVIIDWMRKIVDVVAEMKNGHYIKCKRIDESAPEPSNIFQNENGYKYSFECGHELFSHEVVQMSAALAQSYDGSSKLYRKPYHGPLYRPELGYMIYPLSREKNRHHPGKIPENTYFVVMSPADKIIDVIAELMHGDFMKCDRTTKVPPDIESDDDLRLGYSCGPEFFEISHMRKTAKLAN
ncbi:hypothetical protein EPUL_005659, partial [Erysiphe pulchra]